jgi:hypothetical protein
MPRPRRWYHAISDLFARPPSVPTKTPGPRLERAAFIATVVVAIASGVLIGGGLARDAGWAWQVGLVGVALAVLLAFILTRSLERRLWALFFTFMAGAAGSLAAPVYSLSLVGQAGDPGGTGLSGAAEMSSGGSIATTALWLTGAAIAAICAFLVRRD